MTERKELQSRLSILAASGISALLGQIGGRGLSLATNMILARMLTPSSLGLFGLGWTVLRLLEFPATLGSDKAVIRFGSMYLKRDEAAFRSAVGHALTIVTIAGTSAAILLFAFSSWISGRIFNKPGLSPVLTILSIAVPLTAISRVVAALTRVTQRSHWSVIARDIAPAGASLALIAVAWRLGLGLRGVAKATKLSNLISVLVGTWFVCHLYPGLLSPKQFHGAQIEGFMSFSVLASLGGSFAMLSGRVDRLVIGMLCPSEDVAVYHLVGLLLGIFPVLLGAIGLAITPIVGDLHSRQLKEQVQEIYRTGSRWLLLAGSPIVITLLFVPQESLIAVFGQEYGRGGSLLVILVLGHLASLCSGTAGPLLVVTGHHRAWFLVSTGALSVNVFLTCLFTKRWGPEGAALATAISLALLHGGGALLARRALGTWPFGWRDRRLFLALLMTLSALGILAAWQPLAGTARVSLTAVTAAGTLLTSLLVLRVDSPLGRSCTTSVLGAIRMLFETRPPTSQDAERRVHKLGKSQR